ncbi:MAG: hypothetical protein ACK4FP_11780 [Azonexus sp.]
MTIIVARRCVSCEKWPVGSNSPLNSAAFNSSGTSPFNRAQTAPASLPIPPPKNAIVIFYSYKDCLIYLLTSETIQQITETANRVGDDYQL